MKNAVIRAVMILVLSVASIAGYNCLSSHWCMAGHNAHGQLDQPNQKIFDYILLVAILVFPILSLFGAANRIKVLAWYLALIVLSFLANVFGLTILPLVVFHIFKNPRINYAIPKG